jgi:hypothetical protein
MDSHQRQRINVDTIIRKMAKKVSFLGRIQQKLTKTSKITIYNSIISPHLDYCSSILLLANEEYLNRMQIIQNREMRIILRCHRWTDVKTMLDKSWVAIDKKTDIWTRLCLYSRSNTTWPQIILHPNCCTQEKLQHTYSGMLMIFVCHGTTAHTHKTLNGMLDWMNSINYRWMWKAVIIWTTLKNKWMNIWNWNIRFDDLLYYVNL